MVDISKYRARIGQFGQRKKNRKFLYRNFSCDTGSYQGKQTMNCFGVILKICFILTFLVVSSSRKEYPGLNQTPSLLMICSQPQLISLVWSENPVAQIQLLYQKRGKKQSKNFLAKYQNGNRNKKGIHNMHLNIRSLGNKIIEVKHLIKSHNPHIFGISECELKKVQDKYDEKKLQVPGYDLLFPKSWSKHGRARVVVYVKKTLEYQQVHDLEDETVQSIWIKGGFKKSKKIFYCHGYREHTSILGNSIRSQTEYLRSFLSQWEEATLHGNPTDPNETHICGDMNLDSLDGKWLRPEYKLFSLSKLVQEACNLSNFSLLVNQPTRSQYNSVQKSTDISCIDHIYTNRKFRCSSATVISFGGSDHDLISYIRYSKDPPGPAKTIRKRSYKNFDQEKFLTELTNVDWSDVYKMNEVDQATEVFSSKFKLVLNSHAPWIIFQQRKNFSPWLTDITKELIQDREKLKSKSVELAQAGDDEAASEEWEKLKKVRNEINNRKKYEEINFKKEKISGSLDSTANTWKSAKSFMEWENTGGPPNQLFNNGKLITKSSEIATIMNEFFIDKVKLIREGIAYLPTVFTKCSEIMIGKSCRLISTMLLQARLINC